jgi:diguanylate cyclase (GGDEF)-like protein/PAS domain S-box-containing protein
MTAGGLYFSQRQRRILDRLAAEAAAQRQQSTDRLELALRGADLGLWDVHGPSGRVIANTRQRMMLGFDPEQPLPDGFAWQKLIHPDDRPAVKAAIEAHVRGDTEAYECEHRMQHRDGHWIWVFSRGIVAERDAAGRPVRMVGTHLDITHSKLADAELARTAELLRRSEEQLRQVTDNLPVLVSSLDLERRFCFANRAYLDWFGIDPASLLGRTIADVYGEATYAAIRHHIDAAMGGATTVYERKMVVPGGLRHVEVTLVPQRGIDGSVRGLHSLILDLTARHEADAQRARSEERLSLALEGSGLALFDWDIPGKRLYQSAQAAVMRGDPPAEEAASPSEFQSFVHPDDLDAMLASINDALTGRTPLYHAEFRIRKLSGAWLWVRARGRVVERDRAGRARRLAGTYADINARKVSEARLRHLAEFDTLTDLPNRAQFMERLQQALAPPRPASPMALLFLDIDHFKTINDTLGHEAGDRLLKVFAQRMRASVRQSDMAARLAGDEFTIVLEGVRDWADAKGVAHKLVEALREPIVLAGRCFEITASVGIAMSIGGETDDAALLRRADAALYEAKRRGRNGFFGDEEGAAEGAQLAA